MIKNIVFDIGNVLAGFNWKNYYKGFGFSDEVFEKLADATVRNPFWNQMDVGLLSNEELLEGFINNDPSLEKELRMIFENLNGIMLKFDYAVPWVKDLKEQGYGVYFISNFSSQIYEQCKEKLRFLEEMDGGLMSYQEHLTKPAPEIYRLLFSRYGLKAEECVFIDDTEVNIVAAKKEGMKGILFHTREQACNELELLLKT